MVIIRKLEGKPQWDKIITICLYNERFVFRIQKDFLKFNNKKWFWALSNVLRLGSKITPNWKRLLFSQISRVICFAAFREMFLVFSPIQLGELLDSIDTYFALLCIFHIFYSEHVLLLIIGGKLKEVKDMPPFLRSTYTFKQLMWIQPFE